MRNPSGYGAIIRLKGKRRKPYAVRTSNIGEYINVSAPQELPDDVLSSFKHMGFRWRKKESVWTVLSSDKTKPFADRLKEKYGYNLSVSFRQYYTYHAYFEKISEAHTFLAEWNSGRTIKEEVKYVDSLSFAEMYRRWKEYRMGLKSNPSASTWRTYEAGYKHLHQLHKRPFTSIKANEMQEIINAYNDRSKSTVKAMGIVLRGMYNYARMNKFITEDVSEFLIYEWSEPKEELHKSFSTEELNILWKNLGKIENVDLLLIYIYTGVRPIELLTILTENVHLEERYFVGGVKTEYGKNRIIPIADKIFPLVEKYYNPDNKYLISTKRNKHFQYKFYYYHVFMPLMKTLSFDHLPHDTRHTFASMMDSAGANVVCTKLIMGHSMKGDITKSVYTHKTVEELLFEVNKI